LCNHLGEIGGRVSGLLLSEFVAEETERETDAIKYFYKFEKTGFEKRNTENMSEYTKFHEDAMQF
jgi:hypothetical protein